MQEHPGIVHEQLVAVVEGMGYHLVDAQAANVKGSLRVNCIIYSPAGINTGDCEKVSRAIRPRLELLYDSQEVSLEVSTPGLERKFSSLYEFAIFTGKLVKVMVEGGHWHSGIIADVNEKNITLENQGSDPVALGRQTIQKAQLVYQEVK